MTETVDILLKLSLTH